MKTNLDPRPGDPFPLTTHLLQKITELEREVMEQARLNGMGSEREASLLGNVARLERENAALRVENAALKKAFDRLEQKFSVIDAKSDKADNSAIKRPIYQTLNTIKRTSDDIC